MRADIPGAGAIQVGLGGEAGHSLRAGELAIMRQTGHRSLAMVRRYIRDESLFRENPAESWSFKEPIGAARLPGEGNF